MPIRAVFLAALVLAACQSEGPARIVSAPTPPEFVRGEQLFNQHCAVCHGRRAGGTRQGPSFLDPIYKPSHHADGAFLLAASRGVQAHHWNFGPMPPVPAASPDDVAQITKYVRWLQREAGVE